MRRAWAVGLAAIGVTAAGAVVLGLWQKSGPADGAQSAASSDARVTPDVAAGVRSPREPVVLVIDRRFDAAAGMLAYSEFELSGEPLAEALGLDLDVLDGNAPGEPTRFDYTAGIESYEYSEEAMYALDFQSRMGPHLANGPVNADRGGDLASLGARFIALAEAVGIAPDELPQNLYPISLPYALALPEFAGPVDTRRVGGDVIELSGAEGAPKETPIDLPAYLRDFGSLAWKSETAERLFTPAAIGGALLKETLWAQDFLSGMHTIDGDAEVEASGPNMDADGVHALGVSSIDGVNGVVLTEIAWDKLRIVAERLAYDGERLGARFDPSYDPAKRPIWLPHAVSVTESEANGVRAIGGLTVSDATSQLRDTWLLLWATSEFYAFSDGRLAHERQNPAFRAVFDGAPFPPAPEANRDADPANDVRADDPFSVAANVAHLLFENLAGLHLDAATNTLRESWDQKGGRGAISTPDVAYAIVALSVFQRAQDALPVGYASGAGAANGLETARGRRALELIESQADFLVERLGAPGALLADRYTTTAATAGTAAPLAFEAGPTASLGTQFAAIRGLAAAFVATGNERYRERARQLFGSVESRMFDPAIGTWADVPGRPTEHSAFTAAAISGGLRALMLNLRNAEGESDPELELSHVADRYVAWFDAVIQGGATDQGMQLAEWLGDSGENIQSGNASTDTDGDHVPQITAAGGAHGTATTLARSVRVLAAESTPQTPEP